MLTTADALLGALNTTLAAGHYNMDELTVVLTKMSKMGLITLEDGIIFAN